MNRRALEQQLEKILPLYKSWGIKGVKYGFVQVGSQQWTSWLHDAVIKAAENNLMVDVHDEYRPTGFSRTYPNFMTQEGIRGDEESPTNEHTLITLFTRMIAGAGDNTNCYFSKRVDEKMGSHASQLAKAVCLYSPWQFLYWYDRPASSPAKIGGAGNNERFIQELPELTFFDRLPTVWEDTKVLEGKIGEYAIIARKSGNSWYIGSLTNETREVIIPLAFLDTDVDYIATIYFDDKNVNTKTKVGIKQETVNSDSVMKFILNRRNGLAIIFDKI